MKKLVLLAAAFCALAFAGNGLQADIVNIDFDVTGINSWDSLGDLDNEVYGVDLGAGFLNYHVIGLSWDVTIETVGNSYLSEAAVWFHNGSLRLNPGVSWNRPGIENFNSGGIVDLIGLGVDWNQASNITTLEFFEWPVDDFRDGIDAIWRQGTITLQVDRTAIPEPASAVILGALLLTGGFVRRRLV